MDRRPDSTVTAFAAPLPATTAAAPESAPPSVAAELDALRSRGAALEEAPRKAASGRRSRGASGDGARARPSPAVPAPRRGRARFGGEIRTRPEMRTPSDYRLPGTFGRPAADAEDDDDDYVQMRTRLHATFDASERTTACVQIQDSRAWGDEGTVLRDLKNVDLHQGWVEWRRGKEHRVALKVGRQELSYGDRRLVSPLTGSTWRAPGTPRG